MHAIQACHLRFNRRTAGTSVAGTYRARYYFVSKARSKAITLVVKRSRHVCRRQLSSEALF